MTAVRADFRWIDAERGNPGPYGSNPIGAYTAVDRVSRGGDTQRQLGLHGRLPWGSVLAGRIQQRWQVTVRRSGQPLSQQLRRLVLRDSPRHRADADRRRPHTDDGPHRRRGRLRRARAQHVHHGRAVSGSADRAPHVRRLRRGAPGPGRACQRQRRPASRRHPPQRARGRPQSLRPTPGVCRRVGDLGEPAPGADASWRGRTGAASRGRRCVQASARASGRQTPSSWRSPTTRA